MNVTAKLQRAQNELVRPVLKAFLEAGTAESEAGKALTSDQRESALLVAGILSSIKILISQAANRILEMELDELDECVGPASCAATKSSPAMMCVRARRRATRGSTSEAAGSGVT